MDRNMKINEVSSSLRRQVTDLLIDGGCSINKKSVDNICILLCNSIIGEIEPSVSTDVIYSRILFWTDVKKCIQLKYYDVNGNRIISATDENGKDVKDIIAAYKR